METVNSGSYRWDWVKASRDLKEMTWEEFHELFMSKYFLAFSPHEKSREFLKLKQGTITMLEYVAKFTELARFADDYLANDMAKVRKLKDGLKLSIKGKIVGHLLQDMDSMVKTALAIEREVDAAWSIRDSSASDKKKGDRSSYFSSKKKSKGLLLRSGFKDKATVRINRFLQGRRHFRTPGQPGQGTCYHCHQPRHLRWDCPQRQES